MVFMSPADKTCRLLSYKLRHMFLPFFFLHVDALTYFHPENIKVYLKKNSNKLSQHLLAAELYQLVPLQATLIAPFSPRNRLCDIITAADCIHWSSFRRRQHACAALPSVTHILHCQRIIDPHSEPPGAKKASSKPDECIYQY